MDKLSADKVASYYYALGQQDALHNLQKTAAVDFSEIQEAMELQRALNQGTMADRIGSTIEERRREGAIGGTLTGGALGAILGGAVGSQKGKALGLLGALLGGGSGAVTGNLLGRATGMATGGLQGTLSAVPGVMGAADYISQPLDQY